MAKIQAHLIISGRVQGVFYRVSAQDKAKRLLLNGWVKNKPDGTVECLVEGKEDAVEEFINWAKIGPNAAKVEDIQVTRSNFTGSFKSFEIRHM